MAATLTMSEEVKTFLEREDFQSEWDGANKNDLLAISNCLGLGYTVDNLKPHIKSGIKFLDRCKETNACEWKRGF